jgi:hypothetical protein
MKKVFAIIAISVLGVLLFTSCTKGGTKEDEKTAITNTLTIRGGSLPVRMCIFAIYDDNVNFDLDAGTEDAGLHGYGGFPASWIGKTTQLSGPFFMSFNPTSGERSIDPEIKSGTVTITQLETGKLHVVVDAIETNGDKFSLNTASYDETNIDWDNFTFK